GRQDRPLGRHQFEPSLVLARNRGSPRAGAGRPRPPNRRRAPRRQPPPRRRRLYGRTLARHLRADGAGSLREERNSVGSRGGTAVVSPEAPKDQRNQRGRGALSPVLAD